MKNSKMLIAVALVLIIAVAAIAAVFVMNGGDDSPQTHDYGGELLIYGNANEDSVVDENDVKYIQGVIDGTNKKTEFSDANKDGVVDSKDVDQVRNMIDRKDGLKVWYIDGNDEVNTVEWPLNKIVVLSNSPQLMALAVGLDDSKIIAYTKVDSIVFQSFSKAKVLSSSSLSDFDIITSAGVPDAVIIGNGSPTASDVKALYDKAGIDIIPIVGMDGAESSSSALTLGYLVDCVDQSQEYSKWCNDMLSDISAKVQSIPDSSRKDGFVWFGAFAAAGYDNAYTKAFEYAGGKTVADWSGWQRLDSDNSTWILNYNDKCDVIVRIYTMGYGVSDDARKAVYNQYGDIVKQMDAYKSGNFCLIDFTLPQVLRMAYMAEFMYPEVFGSGYADEWHQKLVDIYGIDYKVDGQFMITADKV